jgi:hypothetical protein
MCREHYNGLATPRTAAALTVEARLGTLLMGMSRALPLLLAALSCAPALARGQESARALLEQGVDAREAGHDEEALALFVRANELEASGQALAQIGLANQALGRWVEAERFLSQALESDDRWVRRRQEPLQAALATVRERLGTLELTGGLDGAEVRIDGEAVGTLPLSEPLRVPAGSVALEVRAPDYLPFQRTVQVPGGGVAREEIELVAVARGGDASAPGVAAGEWQPGVLTWVGTPIAVVGLLGAAILGPLFLTERDAYIAMPTFEGADRAEALGIATDVSFGLLALGGILVVVGLATGGVSRSENVSLNGGRLVVHF